MQPEQHDIRDQDRLSERRDVSYERTDASLKWILGLIIGAMRSSRLVVHYIMLEFE